MNKRPIRSQKKVESKKTKQASNKKNKPRPLQLYISASNNEVTRSHDRLAKNKILPDVVKTPPHSPRLHSSHPQLHTSHHHTHAHKLPLLNNMQAVAMVAVDTEQDKLKVHNFGEGGVKSKRPIRKHPMGRSKSMQPIK